MIKKKRIRTSSITVASTVEPTPPLSSTSVSAKKEDEKLWKATKKVQATYEQNPNTCVYTKRYQHLKNIGEKQ